WSRDSGASARRRLAPLTNLTPRSHCDSLTARRRVTSGRPALAYAVQASWETERILRHARVIPAT
ncbi:MAG: hypothetical protein ACXWQ8_07635, partial [Ktedonobacterales bacterium]